MSRPVREKPKAENCPADKRVSAFFGGSIKIRTADVSAIEDIRSIMKTLARQLLTYSLMGISLYHGNSGSRRAIPLDRRLIHER